MISTLDLYLSGLSAKRKYHVGNCSKHEEIYVIAYDSTLKEDLLNNLIRNKYAVSKYTLRYLMVNFTHKRNRKHGKRRKDKTMEKRNSKYLKYAEIKTEEFVRKVEEALREFDLFAEDDEIEKKGYFDRAEKTFGL